METKFRFAVLLLVYILLSVMSIYAQVPQLINYQGKLDSAGVPFNGARNLTFNIYNVITGGTALWTETQTGVTLTNGVFNVILGSVSAFSTATSPLFVGIGDRYIGIIIGNGLELSPRLKITSVAYSLRTSIADGLADNVVSTPKIQDGAVTQAKLAVGVSIPPSGTAGGDLTGSYPNPTIANGAINSAKILNGTIVGADVDSNTSLVVDTLMINKRVSIGTPYHYYRLLVVDSTAGLPAIYGTNIYNNTSDGKGVWGSSINADGYGYGGYFSGGYYGVYASCQGGTYSGSTWGVSGVASGSAGYRYGVYGSAYGGSYNYGGYFSGNLAYTGSLINASDLKLKENINSLNGVLSKIMQLKPHSYNYKGSGEAARMNLATGTQFGLIAQEVEAVFPELVTDVVHPTNNRDEEPIHYKGIKSIELIPILIQAIKEQQGAIENLQQQISQLKGK